MANYTIKSPEGKLILAATILASAMAFLDGSVVNIAVPTIQKVLHATLGDMEWVINSYALMLAAFILICGSLGDRFGRKKIFVYGIGVFVLSSFLCSIATSIVQLIGYRTLQGIGAAMMIPGSLSIIKHSFEDKVQGKVIGLWSGFSGGVAALGPFLGGWLVQTFGWQSIFYINIPIGLLALFLTLKYVPESRNPQSKRLDFAGTICIFLSLLGFSYALIEAPALGLTHNWVVSSFVIGVVSFLLFVIVEKKVKEPLMPLEIFKSSLVTGSNLVTLFLYFALNGVIFFLIINLSQIQHYSPIAAGLSMLPTILLITFLSGPAGELSDKIGPRVPMILGPLIVSIGMALLLIPGISQNYFINYFPGLVLFGIGMSLVIAPLTKSALAVNHNYSGAASGVNNAVSRVAALLAIALLGAIMTFSFAETLEKNLSQSVLTQSEQSAILDQKQKLGAIVIPGSFNPSSRLTAQDAITDAFLSSFRLTLGISAFCAFIGAVISFFTIHNSKKE